MSTLTEERLIELRKLVRDSERIPINCKQAFYTLVGNRLSGDKLPAAVISIFQNNYSVEVPRYYHIFTVVPKCDREDILYHVYQSVNSKTLKEYAGKPITRKDITSAVKDSTLLYDEFKEEVHLPSDDCCDCASYTVITKKDNKKGFIEWFKNLFWRDHR